MSLFDRSIDAPHFDTLSTADHVLSNGGNDWLWTVTALFLLAFLIVLIPCFTAPESKRVFHYLYALTILTGAICELAQASDLGWSLVHQPDDTTRQLFWVRYVYWAVSFPSVVLGLGLLSNISWVTILTNMYTVWVWMGSYLAAAYTTSDYKWAFFALGTFCYLIVVASTLNESREAAKRVGVGKEYIILAGWINLIWMVYIIAFAVSDGGHVIGVTGAAIIFGVLDLLMIPILAFGFVFGIARRVDFEKLHLDFSEYRFSPMNEPRP